MEVNTSGRVYEHLDKTCLIHDTSLDSAYAVWVNSMRIPVQSLTQTTESNKTVKNLMEVFFDIYPENAGQLTKCQFEYVNIYFNNSN